MNNTQTPMTAKEYLAQIRHIDQQIQNKLDRIQDLRALSQSISVSFEQEPVTHTRNVNVLPDSVIRVWEAEQELDRAIDYLVDLKAEAARLIDQIPDMDCRLILEGKYINLQSFQSIADGLHMSKQHVHRLHDSKALPMVDALLRESMRHPYAQ